MRRYYADNGRHILFDDLREIVRLQGWGLARPRFKQLMDRLDFQNGGDQTKLNAFFTVLPSRGRLSADSEGPSDQQVIDYVREDSFQTVRQIQFSPPTSGTELENTWRGVRWAATGA